MKRITRKVLLFLLLGAILNVAVALSLAFVRPPHWASQPHQLSRSSARMRSPTDQEASELEAVGIRLQKSKNYGFRYIFVARPSERLGWTETPIFRSEVNRPETHVPPRTVNEYFQVATIADSGWPLRSFHEFQICFVRAAPHATPSAKVIEVVEPSNDSRLIPLHPVWPGFAFNTLFYAAFLWLLFAIPFAVRRRRQAKRGLCPDCGYPIGTSPMCTECGKQLKAIRVESAG